MATKDKSSGKKDPGIRSLYKPKGDEKADLRWVYERWRDMDDGLQTHFSGVSLRDKWDEWEKQYEAYREPREEDDWRSNIVVPTTASIVEAQMAEVIDQNIRPRTIARGMEDKPKSQVMNSIMDFTWEVGRADIEMYKILKDALVLGTGIGQEYYRQEKRDVELVDGYDKDGKPKYKKTEMYDYDDVYLEAVKLQDFRVDEKARSFRGSYPARDAIRRYVWREHQFRNFFKGPEWDPLGNAKYVKPGGGDANYYEFFKPPEGFKKDDLIEILWYWSIAPTAGSERADNLIIVANDVVIKRCPIPYNNKRLPFVRAVDSLRPHHFYGKGEAELLESIQEEQTTLRRMVIDRNHLDIDKQFLMSNRETSLSEEDLFARPHALITVDDVNNIKAVEYGDTPRSVFISSEMLKEDASRVTGYDDRMQSVKTPGTATEAAILKEATLKRLRAKIWLLLNLTVYEIGLLRESNIRQFYTIPKVEKIIGEKDSESYKRQVRDAYRLGRLKIQQGGAYREKYRTIRMQDKKLEVTNDGVTIRNSKDPTFFEATPELITPYYGSFDIRLEPTPTPSVSKPLEQERTSMMYDRLVQNPAYDPIKLGDAVLEAHDYDPDEFKKEKDTASKLGEGMIGKSIETATIENQELMQGNQIPPNGTPYATEPHTEIHIAFLESPEMEAEPPTSPKFISLVRHIQGELQMQQQRAQAGGPAMGQAGGQAGGPEDISGYKPPSGPTAVKQTGQIEVPAQAQTQQVANMYSDAMNANG